MRAVLIVIALCSTLFASSPVEACDPASPFALFDRADRVIVGTIATPAATRAHEPLAPVLVTVDTVLKGAATSSVTVFPSKGMCAAELDAGARALIFLDARGAVVGELEGYIVLPDPAPVGASKPATDWPALLVRWAKATDDPARLDLLIGLLELPELDGARNQAADFVVNSPRLLTLIDAPRRARIVKSLAGNHWMPNHTIVILARLRAPELAALLDEPGHHWAYEREMRALLAADHFATVTDRTKLAAAMIAKGATPATRAAALDRCERLRGESIEIYLMYLYDAAHYDDAVDWKKLAAACRR